MLYTNCYINYISNIQIVLPKKLFSTKQFYSSLYL